MNARWSFIVHPRPVRVQQQPVLARRRVRVHSREAEATKQREGGLLTGGRVADGEVQGRSETRVTDSGEDEEAVAGRLQAEKGVSKSRDGLELVDGDEACPMVEEDDI